MKHILRIIFTLTFFSTSLTLFAKSTVDSQLITELKVFDNDSTFRYLFLYNNVGDKLLETKYFKQDNSWVRLSQTEWIYNTGKCVNQIERVWKNAEWQVLFEIDFNYVNALLDTEIHTSYTNKVPFLKKKIVYEYNTSILSSKKEFSYQSNSWIQTLQTDYKYSKPAQVDSVIISVFNSGSVSNLYLMKNSYSAKGLLISQFQQQKSVDSIWVNTQLINWFYTPDSTNVLSQRVKNWNSETSTWENSQRIDFEYDSLNHVISETYQYWKLMYWENDLRYDYVYDTNGNKTKKILSQPIYNEWRGLISINYSDFKANKANLMESKYEFWGGTTGELVTSFIPYDFNNEAAIQKGKSLQISYAAVIDTIESVPNVLDSNHTIPVYPNPSDGIYYVDVQGYGVLSWIITDLHGSKVRMNQQQSTTSGVIDITDLPKGVYIFKATTLTKQYTQKLIKD